MHIYVAGSFAARTLVITYHNSDLTCEFSLFLRGEGSRQRFFIPLRISKHLLDFFRYAAKELFEIADFKYLLFEVQDKPLVVLVCYCLNRLDF